ncbi:MAG: AAA family ATPase [Thiobacillaceae bacterium]
MKPQDVLPQLVDALRQPACYNHPVGQVQHVETHISHLLLTGPYAYKLKKPLNLGFLDFRTLEQRRFYCMEEVRLNRRLAPLDYLGVVTIRGSLSAPHIDGEGPVLDYAVQMRQFDPNATLDRLEERSQLTVRHVDAIAAILAEFHATAQVAEPLSCWGSAAAIWVPVAQNFAQLTAWLESQEDRAMLETLRNWSVAEHARLVADFEQRREHGFIRECHGDLHLGNMAWRDDALLIFDCIEFNPDLRWIDVMSETAFCYMDLLQRGHGEFAARFLNHYLERTGDYGGLALLRYYAVYRAMVRAKVATIRALQPALTEGEAKREARLARAYLHLALEFTQSIAPKLFITHGLSGSGKTTFSQALIEQAGVIRLRSDIERKRLAGLDMLARTNAGVGTGIYGPGSSRRTYGHLAYLAERLLHAGWNVLVDATFVSRWQRELLSHVASACKTPFLILDFPVPVDELRIRVESRREEAKDASEADLGVLDYQIAHHEPLSPEEAKSVVLATSVDHVLSCIARRSAVAL